MYVRSADADHFLSAPPSSKMETIGFEDGDDFDEISPAEVEHKVRVDKATALMGELMLKGWTMLAESCQVFCN